jgi:hypothetical protein
MKCTQSYLTCARSSRFICKSSCKMLINHWRKAQLRVAKFVLRFFTGSNRRLPFIAARRVHPSVLSHQEVRPCSSSSLSPSIPGSLHLYPHPMSDHRLSSCGCVHSSFHAEQAFVNDNLTTSHLNRIQNKGNHPQTLVCPKQIQLYAWE